jgi:hypothetical protein
MKKFLSVVALLLCSTPAALAWNCPTGQIRQQAPPGTPTTAPFYDVVEGIAFICVPSTPPTQPPTATQTQNQTQNSSSNSAATSTSGASSKSTSNATGGNSTSTALGGSATATGGSSAVKNSGNSTLTNSGNSSNTNTSTQSNNSSGNSTSFVENQVRQTPFAYAPDAAFTTSPCVKGFSGGVSSPGLAGSLGISKTDKGCDSRQTAVVFFALGNKTAAARILCSSDAAKRAKLTLDECLAIVAPPVPQIVVPEAPVPPQPQVIIVPVPTPAPVPVAVPAPECSQRKAPQAVHYTRVCKQSTKVANIGFCRLYNGTPAPGCYVLLDEAVGAIGSNNNSRILLTGPVDSGKVVLYLKTHNISLNRITLKLADEQNGTLTVQTEIGE